MSFDVNTRRHLFLDFADFLNLFKPCHLRGIKIVANRYRFFNGVDTNCIEDSASIEEARQAIWEFLNNFINAQDKYEGKWVSPEGSHEAGMIEALAEIVLPPMRIEYVGNPRKASSYVSWDLSNDLQIAFECTDLFETVMTPKGKSVGTILRQAGISDDDEIAPTDWASASN